MSHTNLTDLKNKAFVTALREQIADLALKLAQSKSDTAVAKAALGDTLIRLEAAQKALAVEQAAHAETQRALADAMPAPQPPPPQAPYDPRAPLVIDPSEFRVGKDY